MMATPLRMWPRQGIALAVFSGCSAPSPAVIFSPRRKMRPHKLTRSFFRGCATATSARTAAVA